MILNGENFSKRLESFSDATVKLISETFKHSKKFADEALLIASNSEFSEEEVAQKVRVLLENPHIE